MSKSFSIVLPSSYFFDTISAMPTNGLKTKFSRDLRSWMIEDISFMERGNYEVTIHAELENDTLTWSIVFKAEGGFFFEFSRSKRNSYKSEFGDFLRKFSKNKVTSYAIA